MTEAESKHMAEDFFGFGSWGGDTCFIGPEQGMSKDDSDLQIRFDAWKEMGGLDLLDCKIYHRKIHEYRWHGDGNGRQD